MVTFFDNIEPENNAVDIKNINSIVDLNAYLKECDAALSISDDALRAVFKTYKFDFDYSSMPRDPFSSEYKKWQFSCYEKISGVPYEIKNELSNFINVEKSIVTPFPFYTKSYSTVSDQIIMIGLIIKLMRLTPGAKILEFGAGWGNTAVNLCRMGYETTVIDIEHRYLDIVNGRTKNFETPIKTICGDFFSIEQLNEKYDALLFKECFHHCSDHQKLISLFEDRLTELGIIVFAGEPIYEDFPVPWGVQFDGESVWASRNFKWLELGFKENYFRETMAHYGWVVRKYSFPIVERGTIFIASRK